MKELVVVIFASFQQVVHVTHRLTLILSLLDANWDLEEKQHNTNSLKLSNAL